MKHGVRLLALAALIFVGMQAASAGPLLLESVVTTGIGQVESLGVHGGEVFAGVRPTSGVADARVYRSADGVAFSQVATPSVGNPRTLQSFGDSLYLLGYVGSTQTTGVWRLGASGFENVIANGFGDSTNIDVPGAAVFGDRLYVGTRNDSGAGQVWSSLNGTTWDLASGTGSGLDDPNGKRVGELVSFGGALYAGVRNDVDGANVYRSVDGASWSKVVGSGTGLDGGFGNAANRGIVSSSVFDGQLYVGLKNREDPNARAEVWRTVDGDSWEQANLDGFGNADNRSIDAMLEVDGRLYVGTINPVTGAEVWMTEDGMTWELAASGFGDPTKNIGVRSMTSFDGFLYLGTGNGGFGADSAGEIWRLALPITAVPEPQTGLLMIAGLLTLAALRRPRSRKLV